MTLIEAISLGVVRIELSKNGTIFMVHLYHLYGRSGGLANKKTTTASSAAFKIGERIAKENRFPVLSIVHRIRARELFRRRAALRSCRC